MKARSTLPTTGSTSNSLELLVIIHSHSLFKSCVTFQEVLEFRSSLSDELLCDLPSLECVDARHVRSPGMRSGVILSQRGTHQLTHRNLPYFLLILLKQKPSSFVSEQT